MMGPVTLFFVSSVYTVNGLGLMGKVEPKSGAPLNFLIGLLLLFAAGEVYATTPGEAASRDAAVSLSLIGELLFAFTFLYVAWLNALAQPSSGLNWYCGWACLVSIMLAGGQAIFVSDARSAILWIVWAIVFAGFFAVGAFKRTDVERATGRFVVAAGFTTCVVPGVARLSGIWTSFPVWTVVIVEALPVAWYAAMLLACGRTAPVTQSGPSLGLNAPSKVPSA